MLEQIRVYANEDAEKLRPQLRRGNYTHFFSRLDGLISADEANFKQRLEVEIRGGSLFQDHLKNLQMSNGQKFFDVLLGNADLPYKSRNLAADLGDFSALLDELGIKIADFDEKIYREYLRNYFRLEDFKVTGKIKITGEMILKSPLLIGDGAGETADNFKDIHVLRNHAGAAFIPGTSICGVLREWLANNNPALVEKIFGDMNKMQSSIQIEDIILAGGEIISRDGVKIDGVTGTGVDGGKYDYEAIDRGARGDLNLLINLRGCHDETNIKNFVAKLLRKLENGIRLGALTSKGFGLAVAKNLSAEFFDFRKKADVIAWLTDKPAADKILPAAEKISVNAQDFIVDADFIFNSSFIIRDYDTNEKVGESKISAVSLKSRDDFVIPATSLKGIFRHRAEYILSKLELDKNLLDKLMGASEGDTKIKSRLFARTF